MRYKLWDKRTPRENSNLPTARTNPQNNLQPESLWEKYPVTTQATFIPPAVPIKQAYQNQDQQSPSQQTQYQQPPYQPRYQQPPPQPQYQQPPPVAQPPYDNYQNQQQQSPQTASSYTEQQQPTQMQQHPAQTLKVEPQAPPLQPKASQELSAGGHRNSTASPISAPESPVPPYTGTMPKVPEMSGESGYLAYPINDHYEIRS
jgi:hypothetical protein